MKTMTLLTAAALAGSVAVLPHAVPAQTGGNTTPAVRTDDGRATGAPVPGSNSFTEGQARGRIEEAGFADVTGLSKDDQGIWRGKATRNGSPTDVALDYKGDVFGGAGAAAPGATTTGAAGRDGTSGNLPGTAAGRAADRALGTNATGANPGGDRPDGAAGNPAGTATSRAVDRAQGQSTPPDGTQGNPPGTAAGRAVDRALGTNATGANPGAGTAPSR